METIKKVWKWITTNFRYVLLGSFAVAVLILSLIWGSKNRKIRSLENQLALMNARLQIDKLLIEYSIGIKELTKLRAEEQKVADKIKAIEASLTAKLAPDMTAEQIVEQFKKLGIRD